MKKILIVKKVLPIVLAVLVLQAITFADSQAAPPASGGSYHRVRYGETLFSIGRLYGVSPYSIAQANGLSNPNYIYAGQVLHIPSGQRYNNYSNYNNQYYNNTYYGNRDKNSSNYNNRYYNNTYYGNRYNNSYNNRQYYSNYNCQCYNNYYRNYQNCNQYGGYYNSRYGYGY